ncbi:MAG: TIGR02206 family membrane protein [Phycisphaerales bacterium]|nr:TIGR02206 family membrane protein [Phycisphaerales bacterium]
MNLAQAAAPSWRETFTPFGFFHLCVLVVGGVCISTPIILGMRWRAQSCEPRTRLHDAPMKPDPSAAEPCASSRESTLRAWVGWSTLIAQALMLIYYIRPSRFVLSESLPLHICDLAGWIGGAALVTRKRWLRTLCYYWGFGLCTQAFFTPIVTQGYGHIKFWLYWINHIQIVGCAAYDLVVLRYRPAWRDFLAAAGQTFLYAIALMVPFNWWLGTNYAYTGPSQPDTTTILDALGPWPRRVAWIVLVAAAVLALITLPWTLARARRSAGGTR